MPDEIKLKKCPNCGHAEATVWKYQSDRWMSSTISCHTCGYEVTIKRFINDALGKDMWDTDWEINGLNGVLNLDIKESQVEVVTKLVKDLEPMFSQFVIYCDKPTNHYCGVCQEQSLVPSGEFMVCPNGHYKIRTWAFLTKYLESQGYLLEDFTDARNPGYTFLVSKVVFEELDLKRFKLGLPKTLLVAKVWLGPKNALVLSKPKKYSEELYLALWALLKSRKDSVFTTIEKKE